MAPLMKTMKNRSPSPPLHVHVDESTPVHVHNKKGTKTASKVQKGSKIKVKSDFGNLRRSVKVKTRVPWIPPGKTSVRDAGFKWEGSTNCLEITPLDMEKMMLVLRMNDPSTDEEEFLRSKISTYEKKIDSLMCEVGTLKNEVEQKKSDPSIQRYEAQLEASKRLLDAKNEELHEVSQELAETENENTCLKRSIDRIKEETDLSLRQKELLQQEKSNLLAKLVEAEMDGAEAARQVNLLRDPITQMKQEKQLNSTDINILARQKEILLEKLNTFEETNRTLRTLLREQHSRETETYHLLEQKDLLLKKLSDADTERADLARRATEYSKSLEATRAHLQGQLRSREAENNRLSVQLRNREHNEARHKEEFKLMTAHLDDLRQQMEPEKEALKRSVRVQKLRAERSEEEVQLLNTQLMEKNAELSATLSSMESLKSSYNMLMKEKNQLESEVTMLNDRVASLLEESQKNADKARSEWDSLLDRLHQQITENTSIRLEHEKLKTYLSTVEEKLTLAHNEVQQLKNSLQQYEGLVDTYKDQMKKTRHEADQKSLQLERSDIENKNLKENMNIELEQIHRKFQNRLEELEKLPEMLKMTEKKLQECQEQLQGYEQKSSELSSIILDLHVGMEQQGDKMESRDRYQSAMEVNKHLSFKLEELERRMEDSGTQNRELLQIVSKKEEAIHQNQLRLEEKSQE
ncbi:outer dense fiber protein 2 isoform X2 [Pyxicephalus adspersus]|uniref:Outer dense fiber protein 2 n=1 Tax=Pyxicephalus adspersus TaxID=30357 RepID=A0AAV3A485_PYXAD|nr:TPA: hypothetical protein GDO54_018055 [Pyxicephalus adspersus]